jgi:hypothetical protein
LLRRFVEARDALGLLLTDGSGLPLAATVELISLADPHRIVAHVAIADDRHWASRPGGHLPPAGGVGRPPSPWAALHLPAGRGSRATPAHASRGSVWSQGDPTVPAAMKRAQAEMLRQAWGDRPCSHPALVTEYDGGERTGNRVCTRCGAVAAAAT